MKYLLILPIILISLCIQLPGLPFLQQSQTITEDMGSPDLFVKVEALSSSEIRPGRKVRVLVELRNKQSYELGNVDFRVYDYPCFDEDSSNEFLENCGTLRGNESCMWSWTWTSNSYVGMDRRCKIKFKVSYEASNTISQDIAVMPEYEYIERDIEEILQTFPIQSTSAEGPLDVYLTFSEPQPFLASEPDVTYEYTMYINYFNRGNGFFGDDVIITLTPPSNIDLSCEDGYTGTVTEICTGTATPCGDFYESGPCNSQTGCSWSDITSSCLGIAFSCSGIGETDCKSRDGCVWETEASSLSLNRKLKFIKGRAPQSICYFETSSAPTIDVEPFIIDVDYTYILHNSILITVKSGGIRLPESEPESEPETETCTDVPGSIGCRPRIPCVNPEENIDCYGGEPDIQCIEDNDDTYCCCYVKD